MVESGLATSTSVEAILAVDRSVPSGDEWHPGFRAARSADGIMHHAHIAAVSITIAYLGVLTNQEWIKCIRAHVQINQIAVSSLPVTLPTIRTQYWSCQAMKFPELSLCGGVIKVGVALFADNCRAHVSLIGITIHGRNCTSTTRLNRACVHSPDDVLDFWLLQAHISHFAIRSRAS